MIIIMQRRSDMNGWVAKEEHARSVSLLKSIHDKAGVSGSGMKIKPSLPDGG